MIQWLNQNSGAVMGLLTAVYVVCTLVLCVFAHRSTKITRQLHLDVQRPCVVCDFLTVYAILYFRVRNLGPQPARDIRITVEENPASSYAWNENPAVASGISLLSPGQELLFFYQAPGDFPLAKVAFSVAYTDTANRGFKEEYAHDLSAFRKEDLGRENNSPVVRALNDIAKHLGGLQK